VLDLNDFYPLDPTRSKASVINIPCQSGGGGGTVHWLIIVLLVIGLFSKWKTVNRHEKF